MISFSLVIEENQTMISPSVPDELSILVLRNDDGKTKSGDMITRAYEVMMRERNRLGKINEPRMLK